MQAQWAELEAALAAGRARALGVYNFCAASLDCVLAAATTPPALNYVMRHVGMGPDASDVLAASAARGVRAVAYGTLGEPVALASVLASAALRDVACAHGRSVEEVALRWNLQAGYAVSNRPTADYAPENAPATAACADGACRAAVAAMAHAHGWALTDAEVAALDALRFDEYPQAPTYYSSSGCPDSFGVSAHPTASSCRSNAWSSTVMWC